MLQSNRQLVILAGLLGIVLAIVGQAITLNAPMIDEGGAEMQTWLADNRALALTSAYLLGLGITLTLPLVIALFTRLRAAEGGTGILSAVVLITGTAALAIVGVAIAIFTAAAYRADTISAENAALTNDLVYAAVAVAAFPTAISLLATARVIMQTKTLPAYIAYIAIVAGVVHLVSAAAFDTGDGFNLQIGSAISAIAFYVFALATGITLLRQPEEEASAITLAARAAGGTLGTLPRATGTETSGATETARQQN